MQRKSVISLISYDAHLLPASIKTYYHYVDEIVLGLDEDRITWSKNKFSFDEDALWKELKSIDSKNKIEIVEGNFHKSDVPIENDNFERNYLKSHCSHDWIFSIDADEELVNPKEFFIDYLPIVERYYNKVDILFTWFLPYKELVITDEKTKQKNHEILMIANNDGSFFKGDTQGFVTHKENTFTYARWTNNQERVMSPLAILHWSFCRPEEEVNQKLNNFGHSPESRNDPFFHNWKLVNEHNFHQLKNFKTSGYGENQWETLIKIPKKDLWGLAKQQAQTIF